MKGARGNMGELAIFRWSIHVLGLIYEAVMISLGISSLMAASRTGDKGARILGTGFLLIGCGDFTHTLGHILTDVFPASPEAAAFESIATAVSVTLATMFFLTIQFYASLARTGQLGALDKAMAVVTVIAGITAFSAWAYVELFMAENRALLIALRSVAVLAMVIVGYVGCYSFITMVGEKLREAGPAIVERYKYAFRGMLLMVVAVTLVLTHPFLVHYPLAMLVVTTLKILALMFAALFTYLGIIGPRWFVERLERR